MLGGPFFEDRDKIRVFGEPFKFGLISQQSELELLKYENYGEKFRKMDYFHEIFRSFARAE